jgi:hypothetical protein
MVTLIVKIDDVTHGRLRTIYAETRRTMSDTVRLALEEHFKKLDKEKKDGKKSA